MPGRDHNNEVVSYAKIGFYTHNSDDGRRRLSVSGYGCVCSRYLVRVYFSLLLVLSRTPIFRMSFPGLIFSYALVVHVDLSV